MMQTSRSLTQVPAVPAVAMSTTTQGRCRPASIASSADALAMLKKDTSTIASVSSTSSNTSDLLTPLLPTAAYPTTIFPHQVRAEPMMSSQTQDTPVPGPEDAWLDITLASLCTTSRMVAPICGGQAHEPSLQMSVPPSCSSSRTSEVPHPMLAKRSWSIAAASNLFSLEGGLSDDRSMSVSDLLREILPESSPWSETSYSTMEQTPSGCSLDTSTALGLFFPSEGQTTLGKRSFGDIDAINNYSFASEESAASATAADALLSAGKLSPLGAPSLASNSCAEPPLLQFNQAEERQDQVPVSNLTILNEPPTVTGYSRAVTQMHSERLGALLGLPSPIMQSYQQSNAGTSSKPPGNKRLESSEYPLNFLTAPITSQSASLTAITPAQIRAATKRCLQNAVLGGKMAFFLLDHQDHIVSAADSAILCEMLATGPVGNGEIEETLRQPATWDSLRASKITFSELLSDHQTVAWWQKACREVLLQQYQQDRWASQDRRGGRIPVRHPHYSKEMVLSWKVESGAHQLVEVKVSTVATQSDADEICIFATVRMCRLPTLAAIAAPYTLDPHASWYAPKMARSAHQAHWEVRLLVSRHGLILRISTSRLGDTCRGTRGKNGTSRCTVIRSILGPTCPMPLVGQSLVDTACLTPLLPVAAQAAIVGLAQTVQLNVAGRLIAAVVQPVIENLTKADEIPRRARQVASKVWVTLSSSDPDWSRQHATSEPLTQTSRHNRYSSYGRSASSSFVQSHMHSSHAPRHSISVFVPTSNSLSLPKATPSNRRASVHFDWSSIAKSSAKYSSYQHGLGRIDESEDPRGIGAGVQSEVHDTLTSMTAQLELENRSLRKRLGMQPRNGVT